MIDWYTEWKVWDESIQAYKHNHREIGTTVRDKPAPKSEAQKVWLTQKWAKREVTKWDK